MNGIFQSGGREREGVNFLFFALSFSLLLNGLKRPSYIIMVISSQLWECPRGCEMLMCWGVRSVSNYSLKIRSDSAGARSPLSHLPKPGGASYLSLWLRAGDSYWSLEPWWVREWWLVGVWSYSRVTNLLLSSPLRPVCVGSLSLPPPLPPPPPTSLPPPLHPAIKSIHSATGPTTWRECQTTDLLHK